MNNIENQAQKSRLWASVRSCFDEWEEVAMDVAEFAKGVYNSNQGDLEKAINCYKEIACQGAWMKTKLK